MELSIRPKLDASGAPLPCNFRMPHSVIPCEVCTQPNTTIVHLTKLDPDEDWGEFEWSFRVRDKNINPYMSSSYPGMGAGVGGTYGGAGDYGAAGDTGAGDDDMAGTT